jgi:hypothetical protein
MSLKESLGAGRAKTRKHRVQVEFDDFGWEKLTAEAGRQGTTVEELLNHAALYFLADIDEGRFSSRVLKGLEDHEDPDEAAG